MIPFLNKFVLHNTTGGSGGGDTGNKALRALFTRCTAAQPAETATVKKFSKKKKVELRKERVILNVKFLQVAAHF